MPKLSKYKKDSILYFEGDPKREIFLIKKGAVNVAYRSISGESELNDTLGKGEFFGIKSAIAGFPREETVTSITDSEILVFKIPEFEGLIRQNPSIGLKILKILSYNLRQIGKEEKKIISQNAYEDPGNEVFKMGLYFFNQREYDKAINIWKRFMTYFDGHQDIDEAKDLITKSEEAKKTGYHPTINRRG